MIKNTKKIFIHLILFSLFLIASVQISFLPAQAATNFTLGPGKYIETEASDKYGLDYWPLLVIQVNDDGKISGSARKTMTSQNDGGFVSVSTYDLNITGEYDEETGVFSGNFTITTDRDRQQHIKEFVSKYHQISETVYTGTFSANAKNTQSQVQFTFSGTKNVNISKYISQNGRDNGPSTNSWSATEIVDFPIQGSIPEVAKKGSTLTLVIPAGYPGFGSQETVLEIKDGIIDMKVPYRMGSEFSEASIKGTYDPEKGIIEASFTIEPQNDAANIWIEFNGQLTVDLSKEPTAGFMTVKGDLWQWLDNKNGEDIDKGPVGDYSQRVYYNAKYPDGQEPESKSEKKNIDSNLRFWLTYSSEPSSEKINCFIQRPGSEELEPVSEQTIINVGDTIVNPPNGAKVIIYPQDWYESGIGLNPGTNFTVTDRAEFLSMGEFIYKSQQNRDQSGMNVFYDNFEAQLAKLKIKKKGTTLVLSEDGNSSTVKVLEGTAIATELKTGKIIEINAGKMLIATNKGLEEKSFDTNVENAKWQTFFNSVNEISKKEVSNAPVSTNSQNMIIIILGIGVFIIVLGIAITKIRRIK